MYHILFIHPLMDVWAASTSWQYFDTARMNKEGCANISSFKLFRYIARSRIAKLCSNPIFNYLSII